MSDLVERLRGKATDCHASEEALYHEAAAALEAKDKELAALRERAEGLSGALMAQTDYCVDLQRIIESICRGGPIAEPQTTARHHFNMAVEYTARTETAEQALKPFAALARWLPTKISEEEVLYRASTIVITAGDLRRADRAITGEKS